MPQPGNIAPKVVYERYPGAASGPLPPVYRPRNPQGTALYRIVQQHLETFLAEPLAHGAPPYPRHVEREFRRLLTCNVPAHGFYRVRCPSCGHERLLGLSCAGRLCPSCWARRTADGAAHLVDRVLPSAPYRQLVLSFPYKLRFHLARDPAFLSTMLGAYLKSVFAWQRHRGRKAGLDDGQTGAITFVQKFGSALNANIHLHSLQPDGLFVPEAGGKLIFVPLAPPTDEEVDHLAHRVVRRLTKVAHRYLADDDEYVDPDDEMSTLQHALSVALRPPVRPQPALPLGGLELPPSRQSLCSAVGGFSLHAARTVDEYDREGLEGLCRYGLRAPFSQRRLSVLPDGRVRYELPRPWPTPTGVTELIMEPLVFLKRLAALLPAPYQNLTRYHGVFANRSRFRPLLPLPPRAGDAQLFGTVSHTCIDAQAKLEPQPQPGTQTDLDLALEEHHLENGNEMPLQNATAHHASGDAPTIRPRRLPWASLLKRSLSVDGLECPSCQSQMVLIALISAPAVVSKILHHLHLPSTPPPLAPARRPARQSDLLAQSFEPDELPDDQDYAHALATPTSAVSRAPPSRAHRG